jgi:chromosomal replication initiator protein
MTAKQNPSPMSVKMETMLVIRIAGTKHRLTLEKARDLHAMLSKYLAGNAQTEEAEKVKLVQACVIKHFGLNRQTFMSRAQDQTYSWPRQIAMYLARELAPTLNLTEIGNEFCREHTTVSYGLKEVDARMSTNPKAKLEVEAIRAKLVNNGHTA